MDNKLIFLKLGGSLITKKEERSTINQAALHSACQQIARFKKENPNTRLLIGHGSGSFGHFAAAKHGTRNGYRSDASLDMINDFWVGFLAVYEQARLLNDAVISELRSAGAPVICFSPNTAVTANNGKVSTWDTSTIINALDHGIIPVVFGDVIFDDTMGGTILSTEDLFEYLAVDLRPDLILLAGIEEGAWADYPKNQKLIEQINISSYKELKSSLQGSAAVDVTGGMDSKVSQMLDLIGSSPNLTARIFSGIPENNIYNALCDRPIGTHLHY